MDNDNNKLFLIVDGHAIIFRAWFATKQSLITSYGKNTTGANGFFRMLFKVIKEHKPTNIAVTFDTKAPTFRKEKFPDYKAHRQEVDPELHEQIPIVKEILNSMKVPVFEFDGFEADDLIGTLSKFSSEKGYNNLILTGDADQLQLVDEYTNVLMYSGFGESKIYNSSEVKKRYDGLGPEYVAEIKALEGDPSDNIPGVPGIGKKSSRIILNNLGHFNNLFNKIRDIENISNLRSAKRIMNILEENQDTAKEALELTTIIRDVPIDFNIHKTILEKSVNENTKFILQKYELNYVANRLQELFKINSLKTDESNIINDKDNSYITITQKNQFIKMISEINNVKYFAFDTETTGLNPLTSNLVGISISCKEKTGWYIPIGHNEGKQLQINEIIFELNSIFNNEKIKKFAHNANFDIMVLNNNKISVKNLALDTMIAAALCGYKSLGLKQLSFEIFQNIMQDIKELIGVGQKQITMAEVPINDASKYAISDADYTLRLAMYFKKELEKHNAVNVNKNIELPLIPVILEMQKNGFMIDTKSLEKMSMELEIEIEKLTTHIKDIIGNREINLSSNQQLAKLLIEDLGAPKTRKTKTGWSMDATSLEKLLYTKNLDEKIYKITEGILRLRVISKIKSTYVDSIPQLINKKTNKVHTYFNQVGSSTGRLSSSDPNVQNIPVRTNLGRKVRNSFVADKSNGWQLLSADYSQIELRVLAHLSRESNLLKAFKNNEDIHSATAKLMYNTNDINDEQRRVAKILNFGVIYGLGPLGVARQTDLSREQGKMFIDIYFGKYPGIKDFIEKIKINCKDLGYVETITGRRRYLPDINSKNPRIKSSAERVAVNMPIQGTAADIIKIAMINIHNEIKKNNLNSKMLIQVHDELIFEVAPGELMELQSLVSNHMSHAVNLDVPLEIETKTGYTWGEMDK
ncbi:MAG: DNA polymerase I [Chloroflexi bacterium]|nr:DNA polymerase I [Chloroflexota bacterium]